MDLSADMFDYVVDRIIFKQGFYTPGTHLPIYSLHKLMKSTPDFVLLLRWNFAEEILEQRRDYRDIGGKFFIPSSEIRIM